jgi:hypothetical protein
MEYDCVAFHQQGAFQQLGLSLRNRTAAPQSDSLTVGNALSLDPPCQG